MKYDPKPIWERQVGLPKKYLESKDGREWKFKPAPEGWYERWQEYKKEKELERSAKYAKLAEMRELKRRKKIGEAVKRAAERKKRKAEREKKKLLVKEEALSKEELEAVKSLAREDLIDYGIYMGTEKGDQWEPAWFHEEIASELMKIVKGEHDFDILMVFLPPGHGKSRLGTQLFASYMLGKKPTSQILVASYSGELAERFGSLTRDIVESDKYKELFETTLRKDSRSKDNWETTKGGSYNAVGIGGAVTGKRANVFIIDDLMRGRAEADSKTQRDTAWNFFMSSAFTRGANRLTGEKPVFIFFNTRWHLDDVPGRLMEMAREQENSGTKIKVISYPAVSEKEETSVYTVPDIDGNRREVKHVRKEGEALWEKGYPLVELNKIKSTITGYEWASLYQQNPVLSDNQEFNESFFQEIEIEEVLQKKTRKFMSIDTAISKKASGDYTGITLNFVDTDGFWNVATWQRRMSPKELIEFIFEKWEKYGVEKIGIEKTIYKDAVQEFFNDEMRKRGKFPYVVELQHNQTNKETRIRGLLSYYESKSIKHIKGMCEGLKDELLQFPRGKHDDVIDSLAYQIQLVEKPVIRTGPIPKRPAFVRFR